MENFININNMKSTEKTQNLQYSISKEFLFNLICLKCGKLPKNPVRSSCCLKIFCHECHNNLCSNCEMNSKELTLSKFDLRIYNSLEIKCQYLCCDKLIPLPYILDHEKYCEYNPNFIKKCEKCNLIIDKDYSANVHNCLTDLSSSIEKMEKEINILKNRYDDKNTDIIYKIKHSLKIHKHPLIKVRRDEWICNTCENSFSQWADSFYCDICDFDCCISCFELSYKFPENVSVHKHLMINQFGGKTQMCNICNQTNKNQSLYWLCPIKECKFYQCFFCRFKLVN